MSEQLKLADKVGVEVTTNNPLAHVLRYREVGSWQAIDSQINAELSTDLAERSQKGFVSGCQFEVVGNDLMSDTGLSLHQLLGRGVEAAQKDIVALGSDYGYQREVARLGELDRILDWYQQGAPGVLMVNSLCPDPSELPVEICRRLNFKLERQMSSNVCYQLNQGKLDAHYFSLDDHSRDKHNQLLERLDLAPRYDSSLDILDTAIQIDSAESLREALVDVFGEQDVADIDPLALANIQATYKSISQEVAKSLNHGRVSAGLGRLAVDYCLDISPDQAYDQALAQQDLDKLRSQILPHYAFAQSEIDLGSAAKQAIEEDIHYQGACPTAVTGPKLDASLGLAHTTLLAFKVRLQEAQELIHRRAGHGQCQACQSHKPLYGCGAFCYSCNSQWCREYMSSGRQLSPKQIRKSAFF